MNSRLCPLITSDRELIHRSLTGMPLQDLIFFTEQVFNQLTVEEKITFNINRYCSEYSDVEGRIRFIITLLENAIISMAHIPFAYHRDPRLIALLSQKEYEYYLPIARELGKEAAALTDALDATPVSSIKIVNPRWEHVDETRKEVSPTIAAIGDTIILLVDVAGYPEGAQVTFDVFDGSTDPAMRIETVRGKNEGGTASAQWTVSDPNERGKELKLLFEGSARSKSSGRAPIDKEVGEDSESTAGNMKLVLGDKAFAGADYSIDCDGKEISGTIDDSGLLEPDIPETIYSFDLEIRTDPSVTFKVEIAPLEAIEEVLGVKQRLRNLGYAPGNMDGTEDDDFKAAVRAFQYKTGIAADGIAGSETQTKLKEVYGY